MEVNPLCLWSVWGVLSPPPVASLLVKNVILSPSFTFFFLLLKSLGTKGQKVLIANHYSSPVSHKLYSLGSVSPAHLYGVFLSP